MKIKIRQLYKRYFGEIKIFVIGIITSIFGTVLTVIFLDLKSINPLLFLIYFIVFFIFILLLFLVVNVKRVIFHRLDRLSFILENYFGFSAEKNQYYDRSRHFVIEKQLFSILLVEKLIPTLVKKISNKTQIDELNLFLDSGSTITPIFPLLLEYGVPKKNIKDFHIYTNNLAGIDEIHKIVINNKMKLKENDFILIGGKPLNRYRATTGKFTQNILKDIWANQKKKKSKNILNIGIVTANWINTEKDGRTISLFARGEGHLEFKENIISNCDYSIILSPLGKILRVDNVNDLNKILPNPTNPSKYKSYTVPKDKKDKTILLTSFRNKTSASRLKNVKILFSNIKDTTKNYTLYNKIPSIKIPNNKDDAFKYEFPHEYTWKFIEKLFGM